MLRRKILAATAATLFLSACAQNPIAPSNGTGGLGRAKMKKIILTALMKRGWAVTDEAAGKINARYVKGPNVAAVVISFNDKSYTIDMDKAATTMIKEDGKVHRKYNQWVHTIDSDIQTLILKNRLN